MKTVFLSFSITNSSVTDYFVTVCNKLSQHYNVVVFADKIEKTPFEMLAEIVVYKWPTPRPTTVKSFLFLLKKIRRHKPAIMLSMFGSINIFTITGFLARVKVRIAWVRSLSSQVGETASTQKRKKFVYGIATHLFANSNATSYDLQHVYGIPQSKITVLYNAVRRGHVQNQNPDYHKFIFVGNLKPLKGLHTLLDAMPQVLRKFPEARLEVIGGHLTGRALDEYKNKATVLGIAQSVDFVGWKQKQEIIGALAGANFSVVPSIVEAFGFVVIESFSAGTPVIGSNTTGIAEIVRDKEDGLLFEPGNPDDLARKIIEMYGDSTFRDKCAANCHVRFRDAFEIEKVTDAVVREIGRLA
jgi:glycosyltransferase involved in cell wall biosynthesis